MGIEDINLEKIPSTLRPTDHVWNSNTQRCSCGSHFDTRSGYREHIINLTYRVARQEGYNKGYDDGYEQGRKDYN